MKSGMGILPEVILLLRIVFAILGFLLFLCPQNPGVPRHFLFGVDVVASSPVILGMLEHVGVQFPLDVNNILGLGMELPVQKAAIL